MLPLRISAAVHKWASSCWRVSPLPPSTVWFTFRFDFPFAIGSSLYVVALQSLRACRTYTCFSSRLSEEPRSSFKSRMQLEAPEARYKNIHQIRNVIGELDRNWLPAEILGRCPVQTGQPDGLDSSAAGAKGAVLCGASLHALAHHGGAERWPGLSD